MIGVIEKFLSVKRLDGFVLCIQGWRKTLSSKFLAAWKCLRIVNKGRTFSYKYFLDFEEKYGKISDFRTFSYFKTVSGCRTFSHFISETSATLTACVTILICCFAWTTTSFTLSRASSSPRAGNFNWSLVLFNKDGKLQSKKLMYKWKRGGSTFSPSSECSQGFSCSWISNSGYRSCVSNSAGSGPWFVYCLSPLGRFSLIRASL